MEPTHDLHDLRAHDLDRDRDDLHADREALIEQELESILGFWGYCVGIGAIAGFIVGQILGSLRGL